MLAVDLRFDEVGDRLVRGHRGPSSQLASAPDSTPGESRRQSSTVTVPTRGVLAVGVTPGEQPSTDSL